MKAARPSLFAYQAHKLKKKYRDEVVDIMLMYDEDFKTPWSRDDKADLLSEWKNHHKYCFHKRAQDIDFDNDEANKNSLYFFLKAIKGVFGS